MYIDSNQYGFKLGEGIIMTAKATVQTSLRIDIDLRYELDEIILLKSKHTGERIKQNDLLIKYIKEGIERDKNSLKEE